MHNLLTLMHVLYRRRGIHSFLSFAAVCRGAAGKQQPCVDTPLYCMAF